MRTPTILDIVQAVTEVAPSHPELAVWWFERTSATGAPGAPPVLLVLEARKGASPDTAYIGSELAGRLGTGAVAIRMHRGAGETQALYRLLTSGDGRSAPRRAEGR
jgi:hypothetical protein